MQATIQRLRILPVIAIDRVDDVSPLADALDGAGLPIAEITLRTDVGLEAIAELSTAQ